MEFVVAQVEPVVDPGKLAVMTLDILIQVSHFLFRQDHPVASAGKTAETNFSIPAPPCLGKDPQFGFTSRYPLVEIPYIHHCYLVAVFPGAQQGDQFQSVRQVSAAPPPAACC